MKNGCVPSIFHARLSLILFRNPRSEGSSRPDQGMYIALVAVGNRLLRSFSWG